MQQILEQIGGIGPLLMDAAKALIVLILGWSAASVIGGLVRRRAYALERIDNTIGSFVASLVRWLILVIVVIAILNIFGIQATSLVAMLGAATLAVGMALQGTLSDLAAGFMLIIFRPYRVDQYVDIGGTAGTVREITLFFTELSTPDNVQIIVPNGQAWGSIISNYSHHATRRADLTFGIDYSDDPDRAMEIILAAARADGRVLEDPEPWVRVTNLGNSSVDITARLWCKTEDYWDVKFQLTKAIKLAFDREGITIPYPHTVEIRKNA